MEAEVTLEYADEKTAKAIVNAVSPDNLRVPSGLFIRTRKEDRRMVTTVKYAGKLPTFIATVDDLLFCAATAEKTLQTTKRLR